MRTVTDKRVWCDEHGIDMRQADRLGGWEHLIDLEKNHPEAFALMIGEARKRRGATIPQSFTFDGYTVRQLTEKDRPYLEVQIKADEYHRDWMNADFFLRTQPGEDAWALEDEQGMVVFYFKTATAVRLHIQFPAIESRVDKERNRNGMMKGLAWIEGIFRANRFREILFDTRRAELGNFAKKRLGFRDAPGLLSKALNVVSLNNVQESHSEPWEPFPMPSQEAGGTSNVRG